MTFEEIFNEDGKYSSNDFVEGFCFEIMNGSLIGCQYKDKNDIVLCEPSRLKIIGYLD